MAKLSPAQQADLLYLLNCGSFATRKPSRTLHILRDEGLVRFTTETSIPRGVRVALTAAGVDEAQLIQASVEAGA